MILQHTRGFAIVLCILLSYSQAFAQSALPSNLQVAPVYRNLVASIADRSPTFRQQLLRIANERGLTIDLEVVPHIVGARAMTEMVRQAEGLSVRVQVTRFDNIVELIAHEIEHVIEQIEGLDLTAGAGHSDTGIYTDGTVFETERAKRVGKIVAQEVFLVS